MFDKSDPARSQRMMGLVAHLLSQPYVVDLLGRLEGRRRASSQLVAKLTRLDVTCPIFWPFHAPPLPVCVAEAWGGRIRDVDGNEYIDMHMGWGAQALHGHCPEPVVRFVRDEMGKSTGNGYFNAMELKLVELLHEMLPHNEKFAFFNSGTDATAAAIRLARARTGRRRVAKVEGSLHGVYDLWGNNTAFWYHGYPLNPYPEETEGGVRLDPALAGVVADSRDLLILPQNAARAAALLAKHREELACVIAEPVGSSFPFAEKAIPFTKQLAATCRELRIPFVLDEVLTGFRCGLSGAAATHDIPADMITYGKVITGLGLPLSALGGRSEFLDLAQTSGMAMTDFGRKTCVNTTHMGNHLSLCASFASLSLLREKGERYYQETREKVTTLQKRVDRFRADEGIPVHLVGFGDFIGAFSLLDGRPLENVRDMAAAVNPVGLFLLTLQLRARGVYAFSMPLCFTGGAHSTADLSTVYDAVTDSLREMKANDFPFVLGD